MVKINYSKLSRVTDSTSAYKQRILDEGKKTTQNVWDKLRSIYRKASYFEEISYKEAEDRMNKLLKPLGITVTIDDEGYNVFHYKGQDIDDIILEDDSDWQIAMAIYGEGDFNIDIMEPEEAGISSDDWDDYRNSIGRVNEDATIIEDGWVSPADITVIKGHHPELHNSKLLNKGQVFLIDGEFAEVTPL